MTSPEYVQVSMAAAMTLGFKPGLFFRGTKLHCLNLLMICDGGCRANCGYCGLSRSRSKSDTFIRVSWPTYKLDDVLAAAKECKDFERVCVSMVTHPDCVKVMIPVIEKIKNITNLPVSVLISPTLVTKEDMQKMKDVGADKAGVAIDAATPALFDEFRGKGVSGPHKWDHYIQSLYDAADVFGRGKVGVHLIVGLGETEEEMIKMIDLVWQQVSAPTHLFSFFPERGSIEGGRIQPPVEKYRRVQLARWFINNNYSSYEKMKFENGVVKDFGVSKEIFDKAIKSGYPFRTSGCTGKDEKCSACNRPFGNERPSEEIRNFPFAPEKEDIDLIKKEIYTF
ncbi:MAG: radical SAM protein [Clostridiales bacterium]|nr:MAG: radical SAM protein [Clostridiales bacterium]